MTAIREICPCGARIHIQHPDPAHIAAQWRDSHPRAHRTDSQVRQSLGFIAARTGEGE